MQAERAALFCTQHTDDSLVRRRDLCSGVKVGDEKEFLFDLISYNVQYSENSTLHLTHSLEAVGSIFAGGPTPDLSQCLGQGWWGRSVDESFNWSSCEFLV